MTLNEREATLKRIYAELGELKAASQQPITPTSDFRAWLQAIEAKYPSLAGRPRRAAS